MYQTGELYYRETFRREGIPDFFRASGFTERQFTAAQTWSKIEVQRHRNHYLGISDEHVYGRRKLKPFRKAIEWARKNYTPKWRESTQRQHEIFWAELEKYLGDVDVDSDWNDVFSTFLAVRGLKKNAHGRRRHDFTDHAKYLNVLLKLAHRKMRANGKPFAQHWQKVEAPKVTRRKGRVYTDKEITRLWKAMRQSLRDQFVLSYECIMRKREVLRLEWWQIELKTGKVTLRPEDVKTGSKTGEGREFILSPHALKRMVGRRKRHLKRWGIKNPYVFPSGRLQGKQPIWDNKTAWRLTKKRAGISGRATWHSLRNTAYTKLILEAKKNPTKVGRYGGTRVKTIDDTYLRSRAEQTREISGGIRIRTEE